MATHSSHLAFHVDGSLVAVNTLFEGDHHHTHPFLRDGDELVNTRDAGHGILNRFDHQVFYVFGPGAGKNGHHADEGEVHGWIAIYRELGQRAVAQHHQPQDNHQHG